MTDNARSNSLIPNERPFDSEKHIFTGSTNSEVYLHIANFLKNRTHLSEINIQRCFPDQDIDFAIEYLVFMDIIEENRSDFFSLVPDGIERLNKKIVNAASIKANREVNNERGYVDYESLLNKDVQTLVTSIYFDCYERRSFNNLKFDGIFEDGEYCDHPLYKNILARFQDLTFGDLDNSITMEADGYPRIIEDILFNKLKIPKEVLYSKDSIQNLKTQYQNYIKSIN
jgi:hypothetical protein